VTLRNNLLHNTLQRYRGIAIFGPSGSGKTLTARLISEVNTGFLSLEASTDVVGPLSKLTDLPKLVEALLPFLVLHTSPVDRSSKSPAHLTRERARSVYLELSARYGPDWVGRLIVGLSAFHKRSVVVAGVRGFENAAFLKSQGYLLVYLYGSTEALAARQSARDATLISDALQDQQVEAAAYRTSEIQSISHLALDSTVIGARAIVSTICSRFDARECLTCVNSTANSTISFGSEGICANCQNFAQGISHFRRDEDLRFLTSFRDKNGKYDAMVGMSGGKDSSATAYLLQTLGFRPLGFTFDIGYYPEHLFQRASAVAAGLGIDHKVIPIKKYITAASLQSYKLTADLFDASESPDLAKKFSILYGLGRANYSVKHSTPMPFVRSCVLCRKTVIPAYYAEAIRHGVRLVVLGMNEWTHLSQRVGSNKSVISGIRKLQPFAGCDPVYVAHLPFILGLTKDSLQHILDGLGWVQPAGEDLIESNSNSCLFARAAEGMAYRMLGFHPDETRLAREVTVGFIEKADARRALEKVHTFQKSVRQVLSEAGILT